MTRNRTNGNRVYSSVSDEQLASIIAKEEKEKPYEFSRKGSYEVYDSHSLLINTSARGIDPMRKWL